MIDVMLIYIINSKSSAENIGFSATKDKIVTIIYPRLNNVSRMKLAIKSLL